MEEEIKKKNIFYKIQDKQVKLNYETSKTKYNRKESSYE